MESRDADAERNALAGLPPNRIEALVDGIFAVAMTLLVLELHVPELGHDPSESAMASALLHLAPKVLAYASGFVILGTLWVGHRYQFHFIERSDRALLWINLVFLLAISFLPFVIALIGTYGAMRATCLLYGATLLLAGGCLLAQWQYAAGASRRLVSPSMRPEASAGIRNRVVAGIVGYGAGTVLAFLAPRASLVCYAAMPLLYLLPSRIDRHVTSSR